MSSKLNFKFEPLDMGFFQEFEDNSFSGEPLPRKDVLELLGKEGVAELASFIAEKRKNLVELFGEEEAFFSQTIILDCDEHPLLEFNCNCGTYEKKLISDFEETSLKVKEIIEHNYPQEYLHLANSDENYIVSLHRKGDDILA